MLVISIFLIRLRNNVISSLYFTCPKDIAAVIVDMIVLIIDCLIKRFIEWLSI